MSHPDTPVDQALPPPPDFDAIPYALRDRAQWLVWRFEHNEGKKPRKMPHYIDGGRRVGDQGSDDDRRRLASLAAARAAFDRGGWAGVGFAFLPGDDLIGVDIDDAITTDGEVDPAASKIVEACNSWAEVSQSGRGVHVYLQGVTDSRKVNAAGGRIGLEIFSGRQFFVVTGRTWAGSPAYVRQAGPKLLDRLQAKVQELKDAAAAERETARAIERAAAGPATAPAARARPPRSAAEECAQLLDALAAVRASELTYDEWLSVGMTLAAELGEAGLAEWDRWSALDVDRYPGTAALATKWRSFKGAVPGKLLYKLARQAGWRPPRSEAAPGRRSPAPRERAADPINEPAGGADDAPGDEGPPPAPPGGDGGGGGDGDGVPPLGRHPGGKRRRFPFCNDEGQPKAIRENVAYALQYDPTLAGLVAHNEFSELHEITRATPWRSPPGAWSEFDDLELASYLAYRHGLLLRDVRSVQQAITQAAMRNKVHPLRDWLQGLTWDQTPRLDHWLVDVVDARDTPYARAVGRMFLLGMVARVMRPGCKMDYALILQGAQGAGKSTLFRELASPWFSDTPIRIGDKDAYMAVQGVWLYEFSELDSLAKSEETAIKAFISSPTDRFRPPYGSRMVEVPRRVCLCGTTNSEEFLRDATGGRRFWPIQVREIRIEVLREIREQLFAEAVHRYAAGERWHPARDEEAELFRPEQDKWRLSDVWADLLRAYVDSQAIRDCDEDGDSISMHERCPNAERDFFSTQELLVKALRIEVGRIDSAKQMQRRVGQCMHELGFIAGKGTTGKRKRGYFRPAQPAAAGPDQSPAGSAPDGMGASDRARSMLQGGEVAL